MIAWSRRFALASLALAAPLAHALDTICKRQFLCRAFTSLTLLLRYLQRVVLCAS